MNKFIDQMADSVQKILPYAEEVYKDLHQHRNLVCKKTAHLRLWLLT